MTRTRTIIGVDPGERWVGIVARHGHTLVDYDVVDRHASGRRGCDAPIVDPSQLAGWMEDVTAVLDAVLTATCGGTDETAWKAVDLVAVEFTGAPRGHAAGRDGHLIGLGPLMATAQIGGAVYGWARGHGIPAAYVTPERHGSIDLPAGTPPKVARAVLEQSYPAELIGPRETTGSGKSPRQHTRSAWDIATAGAMQLRAGTPSTEGN